MKRSYIQRQPKKDKRSPDEKAYFAWQLTQPCMVTGHFDIERSHVRRLQYGSGTSRKPPDWFSFPLHTPLHHELHKGSKSWENKFGVQEIYLLKAWKCYGMEKVPEDIRSLISY